MSEDKDHIIAELRADLSRLRLRWQTGPVPEDGLYLYKVLDAGVEWMKVGKFIKGHYFVGIVGWAGPIQPPEEE